MSKMKRIVAAAGIVTFASVVASCSSPPEADVSTGIEWDVRNFATNGKDHEFDHNTGEVIFRSTPTTSMKSVDGPAVADDAEEVFEAGMPGARENYCDQYFDPPAAELAWSQGLTISMVLHYSAKAAVSDHYSDELIEALRETETWLEDNGFSLLPSPDQDVGEAIDKRLAAETEHWEEHYSHLNEERTRLRAQEAKLLEELFSEEGVREAQEALVEYCDISLPEGYSFPTAEELEIHLLTP